MSGIWIGTVFTFSLYIFVPGLMRNFKIGTWFDKELQDERIFGLDFVKVVLHQILLPEHDLNGERCSRGSDPNTVTVKFLSQGS